MRIDAVSGESRIEESMAPGYDVLADKLTWRRHPDSEGRYLNIFIEHNNTCNLQCTPFRESLLR